MIKILVVDDEPGITDIIQDFFKTRGYHVRTANSGEDALSAINEDKPDIIFLDVTMHHGIDGLITLEKIKKEDRNIKVIIISVREEKNIIAKAKELGADMYITKPFRVDYLETVLVKEINNLMKGKTK